MKRTLLVTLDFPPMFGGVANYWANLNRFLSSGRLVVLAPEFDDSLEFDMAQSYLIYRRELLSTKSGVRPKWLPLLYQTFKLARQEKIGKIIVTHILPAGTVALLVKKILRIPYIVSVHGLDIAYCGRSPRKLRLAKIILKNAQAIIANSNYTKNLVLDLKCCGPEKISLVYPCPNINFRETPPEKIAELKKEYGLEDKRIILTVGRLIERKGHDKVIQALPKILEQFSDAVYVIVGKGQNLAYLRELVELLKLQDNVKFFLDVEDHELPAFFQMADVFAMPCRRLADGDVEGFGIVYLEANCFGLPALAGNSGGAPESVETGVNGLVVDPMSVTEIEDAILKLLSDRGMAAMMGAAGRERVARKFNWHEQAQTLIKLLE
jgi:phosphatidylinositol alpha-1,6-mannosyltransferase